MAAKPTVYQNTVKSDSMARWYKRGSILAIARLFYKFGQLLIEVCPFSYKCRQLLKYPQPRVFPTVATKCNMDS